MKIPVLMHYIEMTELEGQQIPRVAGTRMRVSHIVLMHIKGNTPIEWIVENYTGMDFAKVHAALAYYYDHQAEIEAEINSPEGDGITREEFEAKIRERNENNANLP
jgi:uncharacterized protein (DUF433 family)